LREAISPLGPGVRLIEGIAIMVYEEYDFYRSPVVKAQAFFLESKCIRCGFTVLAPALDELLKEEHRHRTICVLTRAGS
jgi:hypothetical protein